MNRPFFLVAVPCTRYTKRPPRMSSCNPIWLTVKNVICTTQSPKSVSTCQAAGRTSTWVIVGTGLSLRVEESMVMVDTSWETNLRWIKFVRVWLTIPLYCMGRSARVILIRLWLIEIWKLISKICISLATPAAGRVV
jgi:hypothetical protein